MEKIKLIPEEKNWFRELKSEAKKIKFVTSGNFEDYREQYENGDMPKDAILESLLDNQ